MIISPLSVIENIYSYFELLLLIYDNQNYLYKSYFTMLDIVFYSRSQNTEMTDWHISPNKLFLLQVQSSILHFCTLLCMLLKVQFNLLYLYLKMK